ncbi:hypothetical protein FB45DRAFT_919663 [Roridomyces roridus]|uniref:Uncharacterized protein n=1 Tax=Roridomyces roridus TaxID=1738132 RepID=A0AAD7BS30_9AGAR|nr:hypothetical protein FB45DRAFT_919663 [Roridomyces roridus]
MFSPTIMSSPQGNLSSRRPGNKRSDSTQSNLDRLAEHLHSNPNLPITFVLLVLIGIHPERLAAQLRASDDAVWLEFRANLIQRWQTVMITTGLVMGAAASALFSDKVAGGSYLMSLGSLCCSLVAITFGTGLSFVVQDAPPSSIVKVAQRPLALLIILALPTFFAICAVLCFYVSITALAVVNILARIGTISGAAFMAFMIAVAGWMVWDMDRGERYRDIGAARVVLPLMERGESISAS